MCLDCGQEFFSPKFEPKATILESAARYNAGSIIQLFNLVAISGTMLI